MRNVNCSNKYESSIRTLYRKMILCVSASWITHFCFNIFSIFYLYVLHICGLKLAVIIFKENVESRLYTLSLYIKSIYFSYLFYLQC